MKKPHASTESGKPTKKESADEHQVTRKDTGARREQRRRHHRKPCRKATFFLIFFHALESTDQLDRDRWNSRFGDLAEARGRREGDGRRTTAGGRRPEDEGRRTKAGGRRPENDGQGAAARGRAAAKGRRPVDGGPSGIRPGAQRSRETKLGSARDGRSGAGQAETGLRSGRRGGGGNRSMAISPARRCSRSGTDLSRSAKIMHGRRPLAVRASTNRRRDEDQRWGGSRSRRRRHELRRAGTLTWALIPCYEYATCIIWRPKATIYSTGTGANMQETLTYGEKYNIHLTKTCEKNMEPYRAWTSRFCG
jgi:hypothetical protein